MHPIERLRFVARANGVPGEVLACEATAALATFAEDPAALLAGCRRVLARQVACGQLWWACARLLTAQDVRRCAAETIDELQGDTTEAALSLALDLDPRGHAGDPADDLDAGPTVVEATAVGHGSALAYASDLPDRPAGSRPGGAGTGGAGAPDPVWLRVPVGIHLADAMFDALVDHLPEPPPGGLELVPLDRFTHVCGPDGPLPLVALGEADCPVAPELFRLAG